MCLSDGLLVQTRCARGIEARPSTSITCSSRRGSWSRCPLRSLAWAGAQLSPSRSLLLRRRTDRHHRTRVPTRTLRAASRASPGPRLFEDRLASNRLELSPLLRAQAECADRNAAADAMHPYIQEGSGCVSATPAAGLFRTHAPGIMASVLYPRIHLEMLLPVAPVANKHYKCATCLCCPVSASRPGGPRAEAGLCERQAIQTRRLED
jgi:hypothetical protein